MRLLILRRSYAFVRNCLTENPSPEVAWAPPDDRNADHPPSQPTGWSRRRVSDEWATPSRRALCPRPNSVISIADEVCSPPLGYKDELMNSCCSDDCTIQIPIQTRMYRPRASKRYEGNSVFLLDGRRWTSLYGCNTSCTGCITPSSAAGIGYSKTYLNWLFP